eukprot:GILI01005012.1.p1 GENE.GILI01005012.1~~GILI01005012.1.p1  ORF type:complete len:359 (+),score=80.93 GILI01005012.1:183-1259(+)
MGNCTSSSSASDAPDAKPVVRKGSSKQFSWDRRAKNPEDFIIKGKRSETVIRPPGSVMGEQFVIEDCQDCDIFVCDYSAAVNIDNCQNCRIFLGPVESSLFIRDSHNCKGVMACRQFRTRGCSGWEILLYVATQPIIEASTDMHFGCFQYFYFSLKDQFDNTNLSVWNNKWWEVYDFSADPSKSNFYLLHPQVNAADLLKPLSPLAPFMSPEEEQVDTQVVPLTWGARPLISEECCFVLFMPNSLARADDLVETIRLLENRLLLVRTRETRLDRSQAELLLSPFKNSKRLVGSLLNAQNGSIVVGAEINGQGCVEHFRQWAGQYEMSHVMVPGIIVSPDTATAHFQCHNFFDVWKDEV